MRSDEEILNMWWTREDIANIAHDNWACWAIYWHTCDYCWETDYYWFFDENKKQYWETINPTKKELKALWFEFKNWIYFYSNKEKHIQLRYVIDVVNFWRYKVWYESDELYLSSIDDIKQMQKAVDEWFINNL